jgi:hypothetical protein
MNFFLCCFVLFLGAIYNGEAEASETILLPFFELSQQKDDESALKFAQQFHQKPVSITGFLYQTTEGGWILDTQPHLKSCCVSSKQRSFKQIHISGLFDHLAQTQTQTQTQSIQLSGEFMILSNKESLPLPVKEFHLFNAMIISDHNRLSLLSILTFIVMAAVCIFVLRYWNKLINEEC